MNSTIDGKGVDVGIVWIPVALHIGKRAVFVQFDELSFNPLDFAHNGQLSGSIFRGSEKRLDIRKVRTIAALLGWCLLQRVSDDFVNLVGLRIILDIVSNKLSLRPIFYLLFYATSHCKPFYEAQEPAEIYNVPMSLYIVS